MNIERISSIIKIFFIIIFSNVINRKLTNNKKYKIQEIIINALVDVIVSFVYIIVKNCSDSILAFIILYLLLSCFSQIINKGRITFSMLTTIISLSICFVSWGISVPICYVIQKIFNIENNFINLFIIIAVQGLLILGFFKIKRFSKGLNFLQSKINNDYIDIFMINMSAIIALTYCLFGDYYGDVTRKIFITFIALAIIMIIMLRKTLILTYKQKLLDNTIKQYEKEIKEKDDKINELANEKFNISKINHEFYNRQRALELKVEETLSSLNVEFGEELNLQDKIKELTKEYSDNLQKVSKLPSIPKTDIEGIDNMFRYMQTECYKNNIDFKLQINCNINHIINNYIPQNKLETLIGDHIRDAIIAINSGNAKYRSILIILGIRDNYYEICICDTGIEFEIDTLIKLGKEPITTHKSTGGTGIGFVTTFETLNKCKASLIIEEKQRVSNSDYTKSVIIRFDNKNEYKIKSYRADSIKAKDKENIIIIENIN